MLWTEAPLPLTIQVILLVIQSFQGEEGESCGLMDKKILNALFFEFDLRMNVDNVDLINELV